MKLNQKQSGQGMTEYVLIVALIAIAVIVAVRTFSGSVSTGFQNASNQISSNTSTNSNGAGGAVGAVGSAASAASGAANAVGSVVK